MQEVQPLAASILGDRVGPQPLRTATIDYGGQEQISRRKDLLWLKETISGSQAGQALTSSFIAMNRLCKMVLDIFLQ